MINSRLGLDLDLATVAAASDCEDDATLLFSESPSRFLVEVRPEDSDSFGALMDGIDVGLIGFVVDEPVLRIDGVDGEEIMRLLSETLKEAWQGVTTAAKG